MKQPSTPIRRHQRGAATLMVALILLVSLTLLTLYAARVTVSEHQSSANDYRAKQAFEAAQAGIEVAAANPQLNGALTRLVGGNAPPLPGNIDTNPPLPNGATYTAAYTRPIAGNLQRILITSTGVSDDRTANKVLRQQLQFRPFPINNVNAGIVAMGNVILSGAANADNGGAANGFSVRAGGTIDPQKASNLTGTSLQNDKTIPQDPDKFFKSIFGDSKSAIQSQATGINCNGPAACNTALDGQQNALIWLTGGGKINADTVIGTAANPVVLIVDGTFDFNGGATVWGLVYYTQNWVNGGGGNATVNGATVVEGGFQTVGTPNFNFNPNVLGPLGPNLGSFEKLAGGWRDF